MTIKYFVRRLAGLLVCGVSAFVAYSILNYGENGFNASEICQFVAVLSILIGVSSVFSPNTSVKDGIISCIVFVVIGGHRFRFGFKRAEFDFQFVGRRHPYPLWFKHFFFYLGNVTAQMRAKCRLFSSFVSSF